MISIVSYIYIYTNVQNVLQDQQVIKETQFVCELNIGTPGTLY